MTKNERPVINKAMILFDIQINDNLPAVGARFCLMGEEVTKQTNLPPEILSVNSLISIDELEFLIETYERGLNALHDILNGRKGGIER